MNRSPVCWSTSTACRWLKVPRRLSWPLSRTGVSSSSKRAERQRLGGRPVERPFSAIGLLPGREDPGELGVDGEALRRVQWPASAIGFRSVSYETPVSTGSNE